jgi:hypothetical protein
MQDYNTIQGSSKKVENFSRKGLITIGSIYSVVTLAAQL